MHAPPERVFASIRSVTASEIAFFRLLTWLRRPRLGATRESILAPPADRPILDVALRSGFVRLAEEPDREIVVGTILGGHMEKALSPADFEALIVPASRRRR